MVQVPDPHRAANARWPSVLGSLVDVGGGASGGDGERLSNHTNVPQMTLND